MLLDYLTLFEKGPALQVVLSTDLKIIAASDAYLKATLTVRENIIGRLFFDVFPDNPNNLENSRNRRASMLQAIESKKPVSLSSLKHDVKIPGTEQYEERYWMSVNIPILGDDGDVLYLIRKVDDVTENVKNEMQKNHAVTQMEKFFSLPNNLMSIGTTDGYFQKLNPSWETIFGFSMEELLSQPFSYFVHPDDVEPTAREVKKLEGGQNVLEFQNRYRCKDGSYKWLLWTTIPFGSFIYSVAKDITSLKQTEEALRSAVRARDEFVSIAGHEFKTPLTSMKLQTQLTTRIAQTTGETEAFSVPRMKKLVEQTDRSLERLSHLVDDMLDISRVATGKLTLHLEQIDLADIVLESTERLQSVIDQQSCTLKYENGTPIVGLWDRFRIDQVVTNLLTNSAKYGSGKPIELSVKRDGDNAVIAVKDYGRGISIQDQERIFQRFERAVSANEISGLGLGLYIAREIVQLHKGTIQVKSQLGQGATFVISLPVMQEVSQSHSVGSQIATSISNEMG